MLKAKLEEYLAETPVIAAATANNWQDAIESPAKVVIFCTANIMNVKDRIEECHKHGKLAFVHIDLSEGIGKDKAGVEFLAKCGIDGIASTRGNLVKYAREQGLITIQRFFALDSKGVASIHDLTASSHPDFIEIMPGVISKIIKQVSGGPIPVMVGGLIDTKEEVIDAINCGAVAISTSKKELWYI
ncbi:MAG: glycerol-3-phosphate responsive antiterminator [Clostridia bacterium]|nr:glycerol-3-phosphate responsive antiterminator [Clostridia bacterium]